MLRYLASQLLQVMVTLLGIVTVVFVLIRLIPGDPAAYMLGDYATKESVAALRHQMGLDLPIYQQYLRFLGRAAEGDLGHSVVTGEPALTEALQSLPPSGALAVSGIVIAVIIGVPLGVIAALRQGSWTDLAAMVIALLGISFPVFWLGLVSILLFSRTLGWLPALGSSSGGGLGSDLVHLVLPACVLGVSVAAYIARLTRSAMLEVLSRDYILVARVLGVREHRIIYHLALRNALVPVLAIVGVTFAWSLGNAILIEAVFSRPGLGSMILKAVFARDYQLVQAGVLVFAVVVVIVNTALDISYAVVDPRRRAG